MCTGVLPACLYVYYMCDWCPGKPEEDVRSLGTEVMEGGQPPCGF